MAFEQDERFTGPSEGSSHEEKEILREQKESFEEAKEYRARFEDEWMENEDMYYGKQWKNDANRPYKNMIFKIVEGEIPILVDSKPAPVFYDLNSDDESQSKAKSLERAVHYSLKKANNDHKQQGAVRSTLIQGPSFQLVEWDPDAENGNGNLKLINLPWRHCYKDPNADFIEEANYFHIHMPVRTDELRRKYPKFKDKIKKEPADKYAQGYDQSNYGNADRLNFNPVGLGGGKADLKNMSWVLITWKKDYTMIKVPEEETIAEINKEHGQFSIGDIPDVGKYEDHDGHYEAHSAFGRQFAAEFLGIAPEDLTEEDYQNALGQSEILRTLEDHKEMHGIFKEINEKGERPKYYNNLRVIISHRDVILYDGSDPDEIGEIPVIEYFAYRVDGMPYPIGEVKNLVSPQKSLNEMDWREYQGLRLNANPAWLLDEEADVNEKKLTNQDGLIIKKKKAGDVQRLAPGQVSPQFQNRKIADQQAMEDISGVNEASQGVREKDVVSGKALIHLANQSAGRIRLKTKNLEKSEIRKGYLVARLIIKYWTTERKLRLVDQATGKSENFVFNPEDIQDLNYDVGVTSGSIPSYEREGVYNVMSELLAQGVITPQAFFQVVDLPHKADLIADAEANNALAQENEMLKSQLEEVLGAVEQGEAAPAQQIPLA